MRFILSVKKREYKLTNITDLVLIMTKDKRLETLDKRRFTAFLK